MGFLNAAFAKCGRISSTFCILLVASFLLSACGGGGGGGGGSAAGSGGSLAITPTSLTFFAQTNKVPPPSQVITATYSESNVAQVVAGWPVGTTPPTWLTLTSGGSTASPVTFNVIPFTAALPVGTYTATVVIGTGTSNGSVISIRNATVTYEIGDLTVSPTSVNLTAPASNTPSGVVPVSVSSSLGSVPWTTIVNYASGNNWLNIAPSSVNLPATLNLSAIALSTGTYLATVTLNDGRSIVLFQVQYTVP